MDGGAETVESVGWIGRARRRVEDRRLLTGSGHFASDVRPAGQVFLAACRSPYARARVNHVDLALARTLPGVVGAWAAADLPTSAAVVREDLASPTLADFARPVLARDEIRHVGEAVAIVVADTPQHAQDAAAGCELDLVPLPAVGTVESALAAEAPRVHADLPSNVALVGQATFGSIDAAFAPDSVVVRERLFMPRVCGAAMEPRAVTALPVGAGVRVWTSTQAVFSVRDHLARALELDKDQVEVVAEDVGGGFGPKGRTYPEEVLVAWVALRLGRPVTWAGTRSEDAATTVQAHGTSFDLELAAAPDGVLRGLRGRLVHDIGAYVSVGAGITTNIITHMLSAYRVPAFEMNHEVVFTHTTPTGTVRGGGRPQGNFAMERMMDRLADQLGLSRVEIRRRNLISPEEMPYTTGLQARGTNVVYDSGDYPYMLERAIALVGEAGLDRPPNGVLRGVGVVMGVESTGMGSGESARVRIAPQGQTQLFIGSSPQGQGHQTMAAQVLADRLGWPIERISVLAADTARVPFGYLTAGSRSAVHVGNAVALAARTARTTLLRLAAERLEVDPSDLRLAQGVVQVVGAPHRSLDASELLPPEGIDVTEAWHPTRPTTYAASCHAAVVEVDVETGKIRVVRYVVVHDSGREINPLLVEGQLHGGIAHGIGFALLESAVFGVDGQPLAQTFLDYALPRAEDTAFQTVLDSAESETPFNPERFKGAGEAGTIPAPAAIASAVESALRPLQPAGRIRRIPIQSEDVMRLLTAPAEVS